MTAVANRHGRVAIIVTAREFEALADAHTLFAEQIESHEAAGVPTEPHEKTSMRALDTLLSKCRDAGIRTGA